MHWPHWDQWPEKSNTKERRSAQEHSITKTNSVGVSYAKKNTYYNTELQNQKQKIPTGNFNSKTSPLVCNIHYKHSFHDVCWPCVDPTDVAICLIPPCRESDAHLGFALSIRIMLICCNLLTDAHTACTRPEHRETT